MAVALGTAAFGGLYGQAADSDDAQIKTAASTLQSAHAAEMLSLIDTAPWYNNSEYILGQALSTLDIPRESYRLATKVGRYPSVTTPSGDFDYSRERILKSIASSLALLKTTYLDIVYLHDVEFIDNRDIIFSVALPALKELQDRGVVKWIGICGYPLQVLDEIIQNSPIPIQIVQTYAHLTLQNVGLLQYAKRWSDQGLKVVNAAPLAMGLLTTAGPPAWHPASESLKSKCQRAASLLPMALEQAAIQYSIYLQQKHENVIMTTVIGCMGEAQVKSTAVCRDAVLNGRRKDSMRYDEDMQRLADTVSSVLGSSFNTPFS